MSQEQMIRCPYCGHSDTYGCETCPRCGNALNAGPSKGFVIRPWIQFVLFVLVIGLALLPYIKPHLPWLEQRIDPGGYLERKADKAFAQKRYVQAATLYRQALHKGQGFSLTRRNKRTQSFTYYKIALCHVYLKKSQEAIHFAEKAIQLNSKWKTPLPHEMLLYLYTFTKQPKRIDRLAPDYERQFGRRWRTWASLGNAYARVDQLKTAARYYQQGLQHFPKNPELLTGLAWTLTHDESSQVPQLKRALALLQRAKKLTRGRQFSVLRTLADTHYRLGHLDKAIHIIQNGKRWARDEKERQSAEEKLLEFQAKKTRQAQPTKPTKPAASPTSLPSPPTSQPTVASLPPQRPETRVHSLPPTTRPKIPTSRKRPQIRRILPPQTRFLPVPLPRQKPHRRSRRLLNPFE